MTTPSHTLSARSNAKTASGVAAVRVGKGRVDAGIPGRNGAVDARRKRASGRAARCAISQLQRTMTKTDERLDDARPETGGTERQLTGGAYYAKTV